MAFLCILCSVIYFLIEMQILLICAVESYLLLISFKNCLRFLKPCPSGRLIIIKISFGSIKAIPVLVLCLCVQISVRNSSYVQ